MNEEITCVFCKEEDFDLIGLKHHLLNHCKEFEETEDIDMTPSDHATGAGC